MASATGASHLQNPGSEEDPTQVVDQRKRKRMMSNRESARRSRMRKQKQLDDLTDRVSQLREENRYIFASVDVTGQRYMNVEAENSVLRARVAELTHRLSSLNGIIGCLTSDSSRVSYGADDLMMINGDSFLEPWSLLYENQPGVMAPAEMFIY